jgi:hypothetical protein
MYSCVGIFCALDLCQFLCVRVLVHTTSSDSVLVGGISIHGWEGGHLHIDTGVGRTTTFENTELRHNGIGVDFSMRANDQVHLSPKAGPSAKSRSYPIVIESPLPKQDEGAFGWSAGRYMDVDIGGASTARNKCTDIKGGGFGRIRHGREVSPATFEVAPRVCCAPLGPIEDSGPDRKGRIRFKISDLNASPELVPGAIETYGTRGRIG